MMGIPTVRKRFKVGDRVVVKAGIPHRFNICHIHEGKHGTVMVVDPTDKSCRVQYDLVYGFMWTGEESLMLESEWVELNKEGGVMTDLKVGDKVMVLPRATYKWGKHPTADSQAAVVTKIGPVEMAYGYGQMGVLVTYPGGWEWWYDPSEVARVDCVTTAGCVTVVSGGCGQPSHCGKVIIEYPTPKPEPVISLDPYQFIRFFDICSEWKDVFKTDRWQDAWNAGVKKHAGMGTMCDWLQKKEGKCVCGKGFAAWKKEAEASLKVKLVDYKGLKDRYFGRKK